MPCPIFRGSGFTAEWRHEDSNLIDRQTENFSWQPRAQRSPSAQHLSSFEFCSHSVLTGRCPPAKQFEQTILLLCVMLSLSLKLLASGQVKLVAQRDAWILNYSQTLGDFGQAVCLSSPAWEALSVRGHIQRDRTRQGVSLI